MKIKTDFITNSSSVSFIVIGGYIDIKKIKDEDVDSAILGTDLDYSFGPDGRCYSDTFMIGIQYTKMKDTETLGEFKGRVKKQIMDSFGIEIIPNHIECCWEDR